ncbi:MAG: sodium-dependent transporter [candidate division WOR-3 bacterium]
MEKKRERWGSRASFLFAVIGSTVGLGNVWRFPYITYENGGGAFLIPYLVALITAGIPLMILEYYVGHFTQSSPPLAFKKVWHRSEWIGWFAILIIFFLSTYYCTIMGWCFNYLYHSFTLRWGNTAQSVSSFFNNSVLQLSKSPSILGGIRWPIVFGLAAVWIWIYLSLFKGIETLGKIVYFTVIIPWVIIVVMVVRGLTLPGALEGIKFYLTPKFPALLNPKVWLAAYGQVFFTLSLAMGTLIVYASYLHEEADITANAYITSVADTLTAFVAGFAVFSTLGYLAQATGVTIKDVVTSGIGLAFVTYPTAISLLPVGAQFFGALFFLLLLTLGIDSAFSMVEPVVESIVDKWGKKKKYVLPIICFLGFLFGFPFATKAGLYWIDIVDHFITNYGITLVGLCECILIGYVLGAKKAREYINRVSEKKIGKWWDIFIMIITPTFLGISFVMQLFKLLFGIIVKKEGYGGYEPWTTYLAIGFILILIISSIFLAKRKGAV